MAAREVVPQFIGKHDWDPDEWQDDATVPMGKRPKTYICAKCGKRISWEMIMAMRNDPCGDEMVPLWFSPTYGLITRGKRDMEDGEELVWVVEQANRVSLRTLLNDGNENPDIPEDAQKLTYQIEVDDAEARLKQATKELSKLRSIIEGLESWADKLEYENPKPGPGGFLAEELRLKLQGL